MRRCTSRSRRSLREPDLVIRLQASAPTLLARVRRRGVAMEQGIDLGYLQRLADAYADFFASYDGAPVFAVDTERFHPARARRRTSPSWCERSSASRDRRGVLGAAAADIAFD